MDPSDHPIRQDHIRPVPNPALASCAFSHGGIGSDSALLQKGSDSSGRSSNPTGFEDSKISKGVTGVTESYPLTKALTGRFLRQQKRKYLESELVWMLTCLG